MGLFSRKPVEESADIYNSDRFRDFKRYLHLYFIDVDKCFVKFNSFDAAENKSLYDAPVIEEIPRHISYYESFLKVYKALTGVEYKDEKSHSDNRDIVEAKVIVDVKNKKIIYILSVKDVDTINVPALKQDKFVYDWLSVNDFLETLYSNKYVNYGDSYRDFVVDSVSELFNIGDYIKTLKYTSNQDV